MRYPASEKLEIIRLVEQSHLPARLRHIAGTQWSTRRYMNMDRLDETMIETNGAVVA